MWVILPEVKPTTVMDPHAPEGAKEIVKVIESDSSLELCVTISSFVLCLVLATMGTRLKGWEVRSVLNLTVQS